MVKEFPQPRELGVRFTDEQRGALKESGMSDADIDAADDAAQRYQALEDLSAWVEKYDWLRYDTAMDEVFAIVDAAVKATLEPAESSDEEREEAGASSRAEGLGAQPRSEDME